VSTLILPANAGPSLNYRNPCNSMYLPSLWPNESTSAGYVI
jgi:hypothetical protein